MRLLSVLLVAPLVIACNDEPTDPPPPATNTITAASNNQFLPPNAPIRTGGTVTWEFQSVAHSVIFDVKAGAPDNIQEPLQNTTEERTFETAGTYRYICGVHPTMFGFINVIAP
jgi:plastocyanin